MVPEDLLFWIAPLGDAPTADPNVLCRRHADAMVVPRGWTLDDRREAQPRLFKPRSTASGATVAPTARRRRHRHDDLDGEQLQIDGTGEIGRPSPSVLAAIDGDDDDDMTTKTTRISRWSQVRRRSHRGSPTSTPVTISVACSR